MSRASWILALALAVPSIASAQSAPSTKDAGDVGITMGYPVGIGLLWHVTDDIAVRPEFTFGWTTSESDFAGDALDRSITSISFGASGLFYLTRDEALRTYVSPRVVWSHQSSDNSSLDSDGLAVSGAFGAQYQLSGRFGVFGEIGVQYSHSSSDSTLSILSATTTSDSWGPRTAIGAVLYF